MKSVPGLEDDYIWQPCTLYMDFKEETEAKATMGECMLPLHAIKL